MNKMITNFDPLPSPTNTVLEISPKFGDNMDFSTTWSEESYTISSPSETASPTVMDQIEPKSSILERLILKFEAGFNTTKGKIAIAVLAIVLIVLIIVMLTIRFTILNQNQPSENSSTSKTSLYHNVPVATTYAPTTYEVGNGGVSNDAPCSSHTVVNDPLRSVHAIGMGGTCDNGPLFNTNIGGRWIRFIGTGGTTIPQTPPGTSHCGSYLTIWFNGTLPTTIGTIVNENLCLTSVITCTLSIPFSIVNCGDFYVYFLRPVYMCNARYCTN